MHELICLGQSCYVIKYEIDFEMVPLLNYSLTATVVWWSEFLATDPEVLGPILGVSRFSEK
jgi:hypothetical protein